MGGPFVIAHSIDRLRAVEYYAATQYTQPYNLLAYRKGDTGICLQHRRL